MITHDYITWSNAIQDAANTKGETICNVCWWIISEEVCCSAVEAYLTDDTNVQECKFNTLSQVLKFIDDKTNKLYLNTIVTIDGQLVVRFQPVNQS